MDSPFTSSQPWYMESPSASTDASDVSVGDSGGSTGRSHFMAASHDRRTTTLLRPFWQSEKNQNRMSSDSSDDVHSSLYRTCANSPDDLDTESMTTDDLSVDRINRLSQSMDKTVSKSENSAQRDLKHCRLSSTNYIFPKQKINPKKRQWICVQSTSPGKLFDEDNPLLKKRQTYEDALKAYRLARVMNSYRPDTHDRISKNEVSATVNESKQSSVVCYADIVDTQSLGGLADSRGFNSQMNSTNNQQYIDTEPLTDCKANSKCRSKHPPTRCLTSVRKSLGKEKRQKLCCCNRQQVPTLRGEVQSRKCHRKRHDDSTFGECRRDVESTDSESTEDLHTSRIYEDNPGVSRHLDHSSIRKWVEDVTQRNCACRKYSFPGQDTKISHLRRRRKKERLCNGSSDKESDTDSFDYPGKSEVGTAATTSNYIRRCQPNRARIHVYEGGLKPKKRNCAWGVDNFNEAERSCQRNKHRNERKHNTLQNSHRQQVRDGCTQCSIVKKRSKKGTNGKSTEICHDKKLQIGSPLPCFKLNKQVGCECGTSGCGTSEVVSRTTMTSEPCHCYRSYTNTCRSRKPRRPQPQQPPRPHDQTANHQTLRERLPAPGSREMSEQTLDADDSHVIHIRLRPGHKNTSQGEEGLSTSTCAGYCTSSCTADSTSTCACRSQQVTGGSCTQQCLKSQIKEMMNQTRSLQKTAQDIEQTQLHEAAACPDTMVFRCSNGNSNVTARLQRADVALTASSRSFVQNAATLLDYYIRRPLCGRCRYLH